MSITPEQLDQIVAMLPTARSFREISRELGLSTYSVGIAAKPFVTLMDLAGTLPKCGCGRPRFHQFGCSVFTGHGSGRARAPARDARESRDISDGATPRRLARRTIIVSLIADGVPYKQIDQMLGLGPGTSRCYRCYLPGDQLAQRLALDRSRSTHLLAADRVTV